MAQDRFDYRKFTKQYIGELTGCLDMLSHDAINDIMHVIYVAVKHRKNIYIIGNGGSATNALHMASDLRMARLPGVRSKMHRQNVRALTDNIALLMAYANDLSYEDVFVEQLYGIVKKGDVLICISTSGNSRNVVRAIEYAKKVGAVSVGLLGHHEGGESAKLVDHSILVKSMVYGICEDIHLMIEHMMVYAYARAVSMIEDGGNGKTSKRHVSPVSK